MFASARHTGQPESYYHGEGRVALTGVKPAFQYKLTDHLGNTMVLFEDKDDDKIITTESMSTDPAMVEVLQRNFYYAFGLPMQGPWNHAPTDPDMPYLYNGKELEGELGLGWMDYGARRYDAAIGRWGGVDPLADLYYGWSSYNYVLGNPISFVDPDGRSVEGWGVNSAGDVLYDDGIDDGNIYYLGDYSGKKLTSQSEADDAKVELQAAVRNFALEDQGLFENVVRSMLGGLSPMVGEINATTSSAYNMRILGLNPAPRDENGDLINSVMSPGDFILDVSLNNREMIGSAGLFKSTLVGHEAVHIRQYVNLYKEHESTGGQFIRSQGYMLKQIDMWEVEAYEAQKKHPTYNLLSDPQRRGVDKKFNFYKTRLRAFNYEE